MTAEIHFGTDGWRAIIGRDFTEDNLVRVIDASVKVFKEEFLALGNSMNEPGCIILGHDCRLDAHRYSQLAAQVVASHGFSVRLSQTYCPTPALCWSIAQDDAVIGGIMLTSSHNPAEYLGVKLRMADGGASPKDFTDRVEAILEDEPTTARGVFEEVDLMSPYLAALKSSVDAEVIRAAGLRVVVDPLYGAGRIYLANTLREMGVEVVEINNADDPTFDGLHPEPILPWIERGVEKVKELGYDACFITDGDADRIGAVDENGTFVNPHRILALIVSHLVEDKKRTGRVVRTLSGSALLERQCGRLGLDLTTTPIGFKWIYGEMEKGDVLIGGEESGGIGIPTHVKERDGLLMALLLVETMAQRGMSLGELVDDMFEKIGRLEYARRDLTITPEQKDLFVSQTVPEHAPNTIAAKRVDSVCRDDGIKYTLDEDAWLLLRPSGTEPLVRVYAEALNAEEVERLLDEGCAIVEKGV